MIWRFCAKDMNEFRHAFLRSEEVWRENVVWTNFRSLILLRRMFFWSFIKLSKLRQSNIVPPKDSDKYIQEDDWCFISQVWIPHMDCGHFMGRTYILKHTANVRCNVNMLYPLIGYLWTGRNCEKIIEDFLKLLFGIDIPTFGTSNNYPAHLC